MAAQPAMREIGIQPREPEQGHRELRRGDRKGKALHAGAQNFSVPFGNGGDQVEGPGERERCGETTSGWDSAFYQL